MALFYVPRESRLKHEPRAKWGIYIGNCKSSKAWQFASGNVPRPHIDISTAARFFEHMNRLDYEQLQLSHSDMLTQLFREAQYSIEPQTPEASAESSDRAEGFFEPASSTVFTEIEREECIEGEDVQPQAKRHLTKEYVAFKP